MCVSRRNASVPRTKPHRSNLHRSRDGQAEESTYNIQQMFLLMFVVRSAQRLATTTQDPRGGQRSLHPKGPLHATSHYESPGCTETSTNSPDYTAILFDGKYVGDVVCTASSLGLPPVHPVLCIQLDTYRLAQLMTISQDVLSTSWATRIADMSNAS